MKGIIDFFPQCIAFLTWELGMRTSSSEGVAIVNYKLPMQHLDLWVGKCIHYTSVKLWSSHTRGDLVHKLILFKMYYLSRLRLLGT